MPTKSSTTLSVKSSVWNQLYFVFATLLGLVCMVIGASSLINTWLTASVFKISEPKYSMPPQPYFDTQQFEKGTEVTTEQREALARWKTDYEQWEREQKNYSYEDTNRQRNYAWSLALLLTGAPVFAIHAPTVFRRAKREG